jgi:hypothetical protein
MISLHITSLLTWRAWCGRASLCVHTLLTPAEEGIDLGALAERLPGFKMHQVLLSGSCACCSGSPAIHTEPSVPV